MTGARRSPAPAVVLLLTLVGLAVRAFHMNAQSLWFDEIGSANVATIPWSELVHAAEAERGVEPTAWLSTAYYAVLRAVLWAPHGSPDWLLRATSVVLGTATIPALAWTAAAFLPTTTVVLVTAALAVSPFHVWYSQEVRPYVLLVLVVTLAMGAFLRALDGGGRPAWIATGLLTTIALYTHPIALGLPVIFGMVLLSTAATNPRRAIPGFVTLAAVGLAFLPAIAMMGRHGANHPADPRPIGLLDLPYSFYAYAVGFSLGPSTTELHARTVSTLLPHLPVVVAATLVFGTLAFRGVLATRRLPWLTALIVVAWLIVPFVLALVIAGTSANPLNVRYAIIAFPAFVILLGLGASDVRRPAIAALVLAAFVLSVVSLAQLAFDARYAKEDCRGLAAALRVESRPDDLVVVNAAYMATAVAYYYPGPAPVVGYPRPAAARDLELATATADVTRMTSDHPRVWLVATRTFHGEERGIVAQALAAHRTLDRTFDLPGITVRRYVD